MAGQHTPDVTVSVGLIEKLAGLRKKKEAPPAPVSRLHSPFLPGLPSGVSPDAARIIAQDSQLSRQLQAAKEVNGLLVKAETEEVKQMQAMANKLLKEYSVDVKPLPCAAEAQACTQCFADNAKEAWRCTGAAEAYRACANAAFAARTARAS